MSNNNNTLYKYNGVNCWCIYWYIYDILFGYDYSYIQLNKFDKNDFKFIQGGCDLNFSQLKFQLLAYNSNRKQMV